MTAPADPSATGPLFEAPAAAVEAFQTVEAVPVVSRDAAYWSASVERLDASAAPAGALNLNVSGRRVTSPVQGFGQLWQKTYRMALEGASVSPQEVIALWKAEFASFWPAGNRFYGPLTGIAPGEVAVLNLAMPGGVTLSTGVLVLYADEESFTLMTPQGHMFAGWITFSADSVDGVTSVEASVLMRASDPIYELGLMFGGHRKEDVFWVTTLRNLAARVGVDAAEPEVVVRCVERRRQWRRAGNVWQNAAVRTSLYTLAHPLRRR